MGHNLHARLSIPSDITLIINGIELRANLDITDTLLPVSEEWHCHFGLRVNVHKAFASDRESPIPRWSYTRMDYQDLRLRVPALAR